MIKAVIAVSLNIFLTTVCSVFAQSHYDETSYRTELEDYINLHNISFSAANGGNHLNISNLDISDLETSVESHMQFCKSQNNMDERFRSKQIRGTDWARRVDKKLAFGMLSSLLFTTYPTNKPNRLSRQKSLTEYFTEVLYIEEI